MKTMPFRNKTWEEYYQETRDSVATIAATHKRALEYLAEWTTVLVEDLEERFPRSSTYLQEANLAGEVATQFGPAIQINWRGRIGEHKSYYMRKGFMVDTNHVLLCRAVEVERSGMRGVEASKYRPNLARLSRGKLVWYVLAKIPPPVARSLKRTVAQIREQLEGEGARMVIYHDRPDLLGGLVEEFGKLVEVKAVDELRLGR